MHFPMGRSRTVCHTLATHLSAPGFNSWLEMSEKLGMPVSHRIHWRMMSNWYVHLSSIYSVIHYDLTSTLC